MPFFNSIEGKIIKSKLRGEWGFLTFTRDKIRNFLQNLTRIQVVRI
jgi:hypothetical protein